jgi:DNA-binding LytR/AlgR family response regulator
MRFAFCDDDELTLGYVAALTEDYMKARGLPAAVDRYSSPDPLLRLIGEKGANPYSAVFLDIGLGDTSGLAVAREIRALDRKFFLIFLTGYSEYMEDSFELHTYDYLRKPVDKSRMERLLDRLVPDIGLEPAITFASDHKKITLKQSDILYIAGKRNGSVIHTASCEYPTCLSLRELSSMVVPPICRCHNGYFVNIRSIVNLSHRTVTMEDGKAIPAGRTFYARFLRDYLLFRQ